MAGQSGGVGGHLLCVLCDPDESATVPAEDPAGIPRLDV